MISDKKLKISLQEMSSRGQKIIAQQSETSYLQAKQQVEQLKRDSKVSNSSKKSRPNS